MQEMKLHFQRFEFKYVIPYETFLEIKKKLKPYVSMDGYAKQSNDKFYEVVSLYYDSPKFYYYNEKMDGVGRRKKIRLRRYRADGEDVGNVFFEIKRKHDAVILKDRVILDKPNYESFISDNTFADTSLAQDNNAQPIIKEYDIERGLRALYPQMLVSYKREPYLGTYNKNFRVTFDYDIKASEAKDLFAKEYSNDMLNGNVVMEIKFNGTLPYYIIELIDSHNLEREAYSKYCNAVEASYVMPDLNSSRNHLFTIDNNLLTQSYERTL